MSIIKNVGDFFLSSWIWSITFDWLHPFIAGISMFCLLRFFIRIHRLKALLISIGSQVFAFFVLYAVIVLGLIQIVGWQFEPLCTEQAMNMLHIFLPSMGVAILHAIVQTVFFIIGRLVWDYNFYALFTITWVSNGVGMLISFIIIRMAELWYYPG